VVRNVRRLGVVASLLLLGAGCGAHAKADWSYSRDTAPAKWGDLDPAYRTCSTGTRQSPVDLGAARPGEAKRLTFAYRATQMEVFDNGRSIEAENENAGGGSIYLGGRWYRLVQFHFHAPSEHTIAGRRFPMELHLVHRSRDGRLAVVGVLIRLGKPNEELAGVLGHVPARGEETEVELDPNGLLPANRSTYRYDGSLTTPPCTEDVSWIVMREPIELSRDQILAFTHRYFGVNRPVQPLNGRTVTATVP
jgi:carbonic anhydrase